MNEFQTVLMPTLSVRRGAEAIEFYKNAFGAVELMRVADPDGAVVAEMSIDGARFFLADESPAYGNFSPETIGGSTTRMGLFVADPDAAARQAIAAGAIEVYPVADQNYGYRLGRVLDPYGHHWEIAKKIE